ncbi:16S rRNA (uracil(1498)-N(3))-methyltransferase [Pseudonocardia ailaonensis]|uniref:Ribosomal RNA small subunit methyltransferase E n=1 Tax=Pseudonocardia ailaonensis TaxID=367279 RepID=A0ABN2N1L2_9PSEU
MSTPPLFLVDELISGHVLLDGPEGRHAAAVKRIRVGETVQLGDGRGAVALAEALSVGKDSVEFAVLARTAYPAPSPRIVLAQALVKGDRGELAVELATEAGIDAILPWRAARCVAKWEQGARGEKALARWRSTVREAAKQARRPWVPEVGEPVSTRQLAARDARILVLHESATSVLAASDLPGQGEVLLVVGPEGGVSDEELATFEAAGARLVRLGPEVLRASTAAAVALGAIGALTRRWSPDVTPTAPCA